MGREYDLFEQLPDGSTMWRSHASDLWRVRPKLQEIAKTTTNECFAIHLPTNEIVARLNVGGRGRNQKPIVFQIAYDDQIAAARAEILRLQGYEVVSVIGNEAAKVILSFPQHSDLFIVGQPAYEGTRKEMVMWLRMKYPGVRILALNPPRIQFSGADDYNVKLRDPETWLPMMAKALSEPHSEGRMMVWRASPEYEGFACTKCDWKPSDPQDRRIAELEFQKHDCTKRPRPVKAKIA